MDTSPNSPPHLDLHPQQSPLTLTLETAEFAGLPTETQSQLNKDPGCQIPSPTLSLPLPPKSQTLTLESSQQSDLPQDQPNQQDEDNPKVLNEDNQDPNHQFGNPSRNPLTSPTPARRPNKRKKGALSWKRQQATEKKVQTLLKTLKPIPFVPIKALDLNRNEKLLKRLELWDFVHIEFDKIIRSDLLAQLIVNYDSKSRSSYVNGFRINLNRPTLGRALKLPVRREKGGSVAQEAVILDVEEYGEFSAFIEEFLSNWVLLHGETWKIPNEVMTWNAEIKNSLPEKVDWAGLVWFMVEKELSQGVKLEDCYYASHLQYMIKLQREEVFFEDETEVEVREEDRVTVDKVVEVDNKSVVMEEINVGLMLGQENIEKKEAKDEAIEVDGKSIIMEEPNVELTLMQENIEKEEAKDEEIVDVEKSKEGDVKVVDECKDDVVQDHCILQHCNAKEDATVIAGEESKLEEGSERTFIGGEEDETKLEEEGKETFLGEEEREMKHWDVKEDTIMIAGEESERTFIGKEEDESKFQEEGEGTFIGAEEGEGTFVIEEEDDEMKLEEEVEREDEEEVDDEEEDEVEFGLMPNQGLGSDGFAGNLQDIDMNNISYGVSGQFNDQSNMDIISPRVEPYTTSSGGQSFFGMKREISYDHNLSHNLLTQGNKRPRTDGSSSKSSEFDLCMDQIQLWVGKARVIVEAKEKEVEELSQNQQILISEVQQRDNMIQHLQMTKYEELKKKDEEIYRIDRELFVMGNLISGYRDALKATRNDFAEYRDKCQLREEPIYKDVGPGGLMLSTMEIERLRLKKEEEDRVQRLIVDRNVKKFEEEFVVLFEGHLNRVQMMDMKLMYLEKKVNQIKEIAKKGTVSQAMKSVEATEP